MNTGLPPAASAPIALRCPKCAAEMTTYERSGIVVDQCRECRGIFLDRGELERLVDIESGTGWTGPRMNVPVPVDPRAFDPRYTAAGSAEVRSGGPRHGTRPHDDSRHREPRGYLPDWHAWDDDDRGDHGDSGARDDRRRDGRKSKPPRRRSILGELLEGFGD
jgi:hypothetical protein